MPRLLLVFEYSTLLGGERSLLATIASVREAGYELFALAPASGELAPELARQGVEVHAWELTDGAGGKRPQPALRAELAQGIARLRPDLVHANSLAMSRLSGPVVAALGIASVGHLRDILSLSRRAVEDLNHHTRLLAVSEATRAWHVAQGLDPSRVFVCHNGVDVERFRPRPPTRFLHAELQLPPHAQLLGSIGQLGARKGLDLTLTAFRQLAARRREPHWIVVGERTSNKDEAVEYERRLKVAASEPPLAGRVHFLGSRRDVERILNELTLLVHAARQEPLGRVLLEAAASGVPTISTDVGGASEIFPRPDFAELLIPPNCPASLESAMERLLANAPRREELSLRLRKRAIDAFGAEAASARLLAHYACVLGRGEAPRVERSERFPSRREN